MAKPEKENLLKAIAGGIATIMVTLIMWVLMQQIGAPEKYALKSDVVKIQDQFIQKPEFSQMCKMQDDRWEQIQKSLERIERKLP